MCFKDKFSEASSVPVYGSCRGHHYGVSSNPVRLTTRLFYFFSLIVYSSCEFTNCESEFLPSPLLPPFSLLYLTL